MAAIKTPGAVILPFPASRAISLDMFERCARGFLANRLPAEDFLTICNQAMQVVGNYTYKKVIYQHRFLALMALGRYYDATADAFVILATFRDTMRHLQMMCSLCLRRYNYFKALEYVDKLIYHAAEEGLDPAEYADEREALCSFTQRIHRLSALELANIFARGEDFAEKRFKGVPIELSGRGWIGVNEESKARFLTFDNTGDYAIRCRFDRNEAPFLRNIITGQRMRVCGRYAFCAKNAIYLDPCFLII